jgi:hypothetical protein
MPQTLKDNVTVRNGSGDSLEIPVVAIRDVPGVKTLAAR